MGICVPMVLVHIPIPIPGSREDRNTEKRPDRFIMFGSIILHLKHNLNEDLFYNKTLLYLKKSCDSFWALWAPGLREYELVFTWHCVRNVKSSTSSLISNNVTLRMHVTTLPGTTMRRGTEVKLRAVWDTSLWSNLSLNIMTFSA